MEGNREVWIDNFRVEVSDTNVSGPPVVRLRYFSQEEQNKDDAARNNPDKEFEDEHEDTVDFLKSKENDILDKVHLRGIHGIKKVFMRETNPKEGDVRNEYDPKTGKKETPKEWVLDTDGTNLLRVMALDEVDYTRTTSNNITEILTCLGIEACRRRLQNQLFHVYNAYGIYINARHSSVLCDA
eukprot:gene3414-2519_t